MNVSQWPVSFMLQLVLQERIMEASAEWILGGEGWIVLRVARGGGYFLTPETASELNVGDGLVWEVDDRTKLRASMLFPLKLQFFRVYPEHLGFLTAKEWLQLTCTRAHSPPGSLVFRSNDAVGLKFTEAIAVSKGKDLLSRCALLNLWAGIVAGFVEPPTPADTAAYRLRQQFRQLLSQTSVMELSTCSVPDLARQLHCGTRQFQRLFRREFGVAFRSLQTELRLSRAHQLLAESGKAINQIAGQCDYRSVSLFRRSFKKRFGMAPGEWRRQALKGI